MHGAKGERHRGQARQQGHERPRRLREQSQVEAHQAIDREPEQGDEQHDGASRAAWTVSGGGCKAGGRLPGGQREGAEEPEERPRLPIRREGELLQLADVEAGNTRRRTRRAKTSTTLAASDNAAEDRQHDRKPARLQDAERHNSIVQHSTNSSPSSATATPVIAACAISRAA